MKAPRNEIEVEWQFEARDLRAVARRLERDPIDPKFAIRRRPTLELFDVYFDTRALELLRAGFVLRWRSTRAPRGPARFEATLKSLTPPKEGLSRRREIREALSLRGNVSPANVERAMAAVRAAHGPVGSRVRALLGVRAIGPLFTLQTSRQRYGIHSGPSAARAPLGEITLDTVRVRARQSRQVSEVLQRVEVEIPPETEARVAPFVSKFVSECELMPPSSPKFASGLRAGEHVFVPLELGPLDVGRNARADVFAYAALRRAGYEFLNREPGVRLGEDPDEVHRMRVASRRLRAGLAFFREVLPRSAETLRTELRAAARALGAVRDLDVLAALLVNETESKPLPTWFRRVAAERSTQHTALLAHLDSRSHERVRQSLIQFLRAGRRSRSGAAATPGLVVLVREFECRRQALHRARARLTLAAHAERFHRARILTKRLRYAIEYGPRLESRNGRRYLRQLIRVQDALGAFQDATSVIRWLTETGGRRTASAREWIVEFERRRARAMRSALRRLDKLELRGARAVTRELERLARKGSAS